MIDKKYQYIFVGFILHIVVFAQGHCHLSNVTLQKGISSLCTLVRSRTHRHNLYVCVDGLKICGDSFFNRFTFFILQTLGLPKRCVFFFDLIAEEVAT